MRDVSLPDAWEQSFDRWLEPFLTAFGHKVRRKWAPIYVRGLLMPGERKSVEPLAARVAPDDVEQLHHFIATSRWDTDAIEEVLLDKADALLGGAEAHLIVDDTAIPKKGEHSVGVAHQYVSVRRIAFLTSEGHSRRCSRGGQDGTVDTRGMGGASRAVEEQWADGRGVRV
jgi:SRSO17 transposase